MENSSLPIVRNLENVFLIDWLTVTFHGLHQWDIKSLLGLDKDIPWQLNQKFMNGYPLDLCFGHIHIRYGADDPQFYDDPGKVNLNMGICLDMSGQGCREFESYSGISWIEFLHRIFAAEDAEGVWINVTRLDLAYDDHSGLLNIWQLRRDVEDRNYISKSRKSMLIWSDDHDSDIQGVTLQIGSKSSPVLIRIYDKAAERGFGTEKHWIRVELQLRDDRAQEALNLLDQSESIGMIASGILRNYCMFVTPTSDSNRARWPIAEYWQRVLEGMEKIRIWVAPGEEYNFSKTERQMVFQYGQAFLAYFAMYGTFSSFLDQCRAEHPELKPKYVAAIEKELYRRKVVQDLMHPKSDPDQEDL